MIKRILLLFFPLLSVAVSWSQLRMPSDSLRIVVDYSRFRGDEKNLYIEVYISFPQQSLTYRPDSAGFSGGVDLTLRAVQKDSVVYADRWLVPHTLRDTARLEKGMNLVSLASMMLPHGTYRLNVTGRDINNPSRLYRDSLLLPVAMIDTQRVVLSDLELATSIKKGTKGSAFYKNTLDVIPNVNGVYGYDQRCYFYVEAYNLLTGPDRSDLLVRAVVYDAIKREILSRERPRKRSGESTVIVDNIDVDKMRTGTYTLVVSLMDSARRTLSATGKKFFVYNESLGVDTSLINLGPRVVVNEFTGMDEVDLDREFRWLRYEAKEEEKDQYDQLKGAEAKRTFMYDFWRRRELGRRDEYLQRVKHSNNSFAVMGREGYKADRGRVYILYGEPDDIDRHPNESGSRPYEIWSYNSIQGGVIFVFLLRQNGGDYELVHSTHRNELHDENWERYAVTN